MLIYFLFVLCKSVLNLTDRMADYMKFQGESASLTAPSLAISMINVDQSEFSGLTFGVSSISSNMIPKVRLSKGYVIIGASHFIYKLLLWTGKVRYPWQIKGLFMFFLISQTHSTKLLKDNFCCIYDFEKPGNAGKRFNKQTWPGLKHLWHV